MQSVIKIKNKYKNGGFIMTTWKCKDCAMEMKLNDGITPQGCPVCGSKNIDSPELEKRMNEYKEKDERLNRITERMNTLYEELKPLAEERKEIMIFWANQRKKGLISEKEYTERLNKFKYRHPGPREGKKKK